jgi:hypothetical protein
MMVHSKGPVWHKKQKDLGIIPLKLKGLDREGTWSFSRADLWVYGHGTFCMTPHKCPVVGLFIYMTNAANEAKLMGKIFDNFKIKVKNVCMDSKADDMGLSNILKENHNVNLITRPRLEMNKSEERRKFIARMEQKKFKEIYKKRSVTVEPLQGLMADIFSISRCWMRGEKNNRWIFAAMGVAVQMAQLSNWREKKSVWKIKELVLGL